MLVLGIALAIAATTAVAAPTSPVASLAASSNVTDTLDPSGFTSAEWIAALQRARDIVGNMTMEEKVNYTDHSLDLKGCASLTLPIARFNISSMCYGDSPSGVNSRYSSQFPAEVSTAATWDESLFLSRAEAMAVEFAAVGIHVPLAIVAGGPMGRSVYGGRNWENWSPDPYLSGVATRMAVEGMQKHGVHGHMKHFLGNEQEYLRIGANYGGYIGGNPNQTVNSIIDPATMREVYAWAFAEGIRAGAASIMCSYNQLDGVVSCENGGLLHTLLKEELNAHSAVVTDWYAANNGTRAAINGTDIIQPITLWGNTIGAQIANGSLPADILDDKIIRQLTPYFALNQSAIPEPDYGRYVATSESRKTNLALAQSSLTLLKNVRSANSTRGLPLNKPTDLLVIGDAAGGGQYGMTSNLGGAFVYSPRNQNTTDSWEEVKGYLSDGWGSGNSPAPYVVDPYMGLTTRGQQEERPVVVDGYFNNDPLAGISSLPQPNAMNSSFLDYKLSYASSAVVFVGTAAMEGYDRVDLKLANSGDELVNYVAERHNDTIVVINAPGPVDMSEWISHPNVTAVLFAYFPGSEGGNAVASVLFGDVNPGGKLPFTIAKNVTDYPRNMYDGPIAVNPVANFTEGTLIDYRYFDNKNITPLFEFGFGLSYTNFTYSDLQISAAAEKQTALVRETNEKLVGGEQGLYDNAYTVTATIQNSGAVNGSEVAQLYIGIPDARSHGMPLRSLRGFAKPMLEAGKSETVTFKLRNKDIAYWSPAEEGWVIPSGNFTVYVGSSSRQLPLSGTFSR